MKKNNSNLFFTCSLIEFIGRKMKLSRDEVVARLGEDTINRIYKYADVLHCEPIEKTADEFITRRNIVGGSYDNVAKCKYTVPDYWDIGKVYSRLIEDVTDNEEEAVKSLIKVYSSDTARSIDNYNSDFYYQPRDYIRECYFANKILT